MTDIRIRPNLSGLNPQETIIAESSYNQFSQYRVASRSLAKTGYYIVTHLDWTASIYFWNGSSVETIASNVTKHRVHVINKYHRTGEYKLINADVWTNYCTNGYSTRIGLKRANKSESVLESASIIAKSHADCLVEGKDGHDIRVQMRNK